MRSLRLLGYKSYGICFQDEEIEVAKLRSSEQSMILHHDNHLTDKSARSVSRRLDRNKTGLTSRSQCRWHRLKLLISNSEIAYEKINWSVTKIIRMDI